MADTQKKNRSLYATFEHIERHHHRRSIFTIHVIFSLALQIAMWFNWYSSYAVRGQGFKNTFFSDRLSVSTGLGLLLAGHFSVMRLLESQDRMIVQALRQNDGEIDENDEFQHRLKRGTDDA